MALAALPPRAWLKFKGFTLGASDSGGPVSPDEVRAAFLSACRDRASPASTILGVLNHLAKMKAALQFAECDRHGRFPLHEAAYAGNIAACRWILSQLRTGSMVYGAPHHTTKLGETPLHLACLKGHANAAQLLLAADGSQVSTRTTAGLSPLHVACSGGFLEITKHLAM